MNVSVFGLGYVGCVTAACLARAGHHVVGVDVNDDKVAMLNQAKPPIIEPGLEELLAEVVGSGHLRATTDAADAIAGCDVALICVGTPSLPNGRPDLDGIARVGEEIGRRLNGGTDPLTVVIRSTVLPGTAETILGPALRDGAARRSCRPIRVAVNPEFMREGSSIKDFEEPPMVLIGADDEAAGDAVAALYDTVQAPLVRTAIRTAEIVKYACNCYHGLKVCFANEMADVCDALGADAQEVMRIFRLDHKLNVSEAYLRPGFAFGGSCLPKDLRALVWAARSHDIDVPVLASILPSNDRQIDQAVDRVLATHRRKVGVIGLAFKPDTDDLRESPVVTLVEQLIGKGCDVRIFDRHVSMARLVGANRRYIEGEIPHISSLLCDTPAQVIAHADVLVLGGRTPEAAEARAAARPDQIVIDLTRSTVAAPVAVAAGAADLQPCPQP
jgi:GDP-mannose 6-dehydrogenase